MSTNDLVHQKLASVPKKSGCYLWKNASNEIIYIGKAKNLFARMHQYFNKALDLKTTKLVANITDFDYVIVSNEKEALILEQILIAQHKPKYNVLLREKKGFPYIVVSNEKYPRLLYKFFSNEKRKNYRAIYGPFMTGHGYEVYNILNRIYPFRKCNLNQERHCMYYYINQCLCPQVDQVDPRIFDAMCQELDQFFHGHSEIVTKRLVSDEQNAVAKLDFELANKYKKIHESLDKLLNEQVIDLQNDASVDIFSYATKANVVAIVIFQYTNGILKSKHEKISLIYGSVEEEITSYLFQYYTLFKFESPKTLLVSLPVSDRQFLEEKLNLKILNPSKGKLHEVMQLALVNAENCLAKNFDRIIQKSQQQQVGLAMLAKICCLENLHTINFLDNSNLFNQNVVGVICHFNDGLPDRYLHRKYVIRQDHHHYNSDYWYTYFVVRKHFSHLQKKQSPLVDLLIVDGGILQINAALQALNELQITLPVIGLVKDDKHRTSAIQLGNEEKFFLSENKLLYNFLAQMQDVTHNYAINFFRQKKMNSFFASFLDTIPQVGKSRRKAVMTHFSAISDLRNASLEQLSQVVPVKVAEKIKQKLQEYDFKQWKQKF